ncbi:MAG: hypothetical protein IT369_06655 [Candidatus Latescibacteria bacterium]|nr:hypothetical protein [Candidatus Latescibacterota bacterium]
MCLPLLLCLLFAFPCLAAFPLVRAITVEGSTRTRADTILREVLLEVGQPCDSALVAESERNLRRLPFLGKVHLHTRPAANGVEVVVEVEDLYSRALSPLLSGQLDELSYGVVALDYNLGGRGQFAQLTLHHRAIGGDQAALLFANPRLGGSPHRLDGEAAWSTEGHDLAGTLSRPFLSLAQPWAYGLSLYDEEQVERLWQAGTLSARYRHASRGGSLWLSRSLGSAIKIRPSFRLSFSDQHYRASAGFAYAPPGRRRLVPSLGLTLWQPRYRQEHYLQQLGRTEDLQVGSWLSLRAGLAWRGLPQRRSYAPLTLQLSPRWVLGAHTYLWATILASVQARPGTYQELNLLGELLAYQRLGECHWLALRLRAEAITRPESRAQFLLGADSGLRGVLPRRFAGQRRLIGNLELRPTVHRRASWVLAGALFADAGAAWSGSLPRLETTAGAGVRLGLPRLYNSPVLRADLARPLSRGAWLLSVGLGQYF